MTADATNQIPQNTGLCLEIDGVYYFVNAVVVREQLGMRSFVSMDFYLNNGKKLSYKTFDMHSSRQAKKVFEDFLQDIVNALAQYGSAVLGYPHLHGLSSAVGSILVSNEQEVFSVSPVEPTEHILTMNKKYLYYNYNANELKMDMLFVATLPIRMGIPNRTVLDRPIPLGYVHYKCPHTFFAFELYPYGYSKTLTLGEDDRLQSKELLMTTIQKLNEEMVKNPYIVVDLKDTFNQVTKELNLPYGSITLTDIQA